MRDREIVQHGLLRVPKLGRNRGIVICERVRREPGHRFEPRAVNATT